MRLLTAELNAVTSSTVAEQMIQFLLDAFIRLNRGENTFEASTHRVPDGGMLGSKLFTLETQRATNLPKKKFQQDTPNVLGPAPPTESGQRGFQLLKEELKLDPGRFWTSFRLSVGQFEALLKVLVSHLKRWSSSYPTIPTDG